MSRVFAPGRVAVITGGASGIGFAVAQKCAVECGMSVCISDVDADALAAAEKALRDQGATYVLAVKCDVVSRMPLDPISCEA